MKLNKLLAAMAVLVSGLNALVVQAGSSAVTEIITVTATRDDQSLQSLAGNTAVLSQEELRLLSHAHIQETLARVPGVNLARGNGQEYLPAVRSPVLTGAGACGSVLSAVDGVALRAAGFCNINELFEAPTEQAERIEVVRGPGSALFGSNAMTGVINVITPGVGGKSDFAWGVEAGPHDYSRLKLSGSQRSGRHGLRADLSLAHDGGYRDDSGFDQQKLLVKHEYSAENLSVATTLLLSNLNQETAGYVNGTDAYKDRHLRSSNPNPEAYRDAQSLRVASRLDYAIDETSKLVLTPYLRYTDMAFLQHFLPGDPLEENVQKSLGVQSAYYKEFSEQLALVVGVDLEYTDGFLKQSQDAPTQGSAFLQATIPEGRHSDYQVDALMAASFAQLSLALSDDLSLTAGLRYEVMDYEYDNRMLSGRTADDGTPCGFGGCRYSRPDDRSDHFENWSPKLGLLYQLSEQNQIYVNMSRGFRAPQATELYRLQREQQVADLDSEKLDSIELGFRGSQGELSYELIAFWMEKKSVIFRDSEYYNVADGETHHRGLELTLGYKLTESVDLSVSGSYAEHEYRDDRLLNGVSIDGNKVDSAPKYFSSVRLGWDFNEKGRAELEWLSLAKYYTDPENLHSYDGHDLVNLRTSWQASERLTLKARITNLTDQRYAERADYSGFSGDRYFPGEPRALYLGVDVSY